MRKFLTLFSALLLTVSMWGAQTKYTMVLHSETASITYDVYNGVATLTLDADASGTTYGYDVILNLHPTSLDNLAGTYTTNGTPQVDNDSKITGTRNTSANRYVITKTGYTTSITIAKVEGLDNTYTIQGKLQALQSKTSTNTPYLYEFAEAAQFTVDPYVTEPAAQAAKSFTTTAIKSTSDYTDDYGYVLFSFQDNNYNTLGLAFIAEEYALASGTYSIGTTNGNLKASIGMDGYYAAPSCANIAWDDYFITGGSVVISYNTKTDSIFMQGTLTSAHGTTINVNVKGKNPFYVPEPETIELTVSNVSVTGTTNLSIGLTATPNNFMIGLNGNTLAGATIANIKADNTYAQFEGYDYSDMDATKTEVNALSIVATGNTDEYKLNATIVCKNKNTYVMKDVVFTYNAWTEEPKDVADFTFTSTSGSEEFLSNKGYMLFTFTANSWDKVEIAFKASAEAAPAAGTYSVVNDNPTNGEIVGSAGKVGNTYNPSMVTLYGTGGYQRFFVRGGSVTVGYSQDNKTLTMTGDVTTYRGTTITLNLAMKNPFLPKEKTLDITSIDATITPTGMDFDIVTASKFDPSEVMLSLIGTAQNPLAIVGSYNYSNFESWYSYADTKDGFYEFKTGSTIEITSGEGGCVMNGTLLCQNGWTYFIEDAPITYAMAVSDLADQTALLNRAMNATIDLTIQRSFVSSTWQTICLPFDIANVAESPLAGAIVKSVTNCSLEGETLLVEAEDVTSMTVGMPYLIMWESGAPENPVFEGVTIKTTEGSTSGNFVANMNAKHYDDVTGKYMVVSGNGLAPMADEGTMKGFRAYFQINAPAGVAPRKFAFATSVVTDNEQVSKSMPIRKALVNGQLLIIKNNHMFNAQAQELK